MLAYLPQSCARQDALEELEKARFTADQISAMQEKTRAVQASMLCDSINHLATRLDALLARRADEAERARRDEEEAEAKRIQDQLAELPDPDDPGVHENTGDLHALSHKDEHDPDDPETDDDMGGVPISYKNVPLSYVRGEHVRGGPKDQAEFELPEDPTGVSIPQPVAIEFDGD